MTGFKDVNLFAMLSEIGEDRVKNILSDFSCPLNEDVESFLRYKAIEFSKQGLSQTHLIFTSYKNEWVLIAYYTLASKYIGISTKELSNRLKSRISKFATRDRATQAYYISAPLIAQLGKNFNNNYNRLISGDELLKIACDKIKSIQMELGGRIVYVECEDKPSLIQFYSDNGFYKFDIRYLDKDETGLHGNYLVQMIKYL